jgi:hypothetical protein
VVPATGSRWTITSREHTASRGRHPTLVLYDEVGWARDAVALRGVEVGEVSFGNLAPVARARIDWTSRDVP